VHGTCTVRAWSGKGMHVVAYLAARGVVHDALAMAGMDEGRHCLTLRSLV